MKKEILLGMVSLVGAISSMQAGAAGTVICAGTAIPNAASAVTGAGGQFVLVTFTPKCSNNIILEGSDNTTFYTVGSASVKGLSAFKGSSVGGGVVPNGSCASTCTTSDVDSAIAAAPSS